MKCIFCDIAAGKSPADIVMKTDELVVIRDAHPMAPVHILIIPKRHIPSLVNLDGADDQALVGKIVKSAVDAAGKEGLTGRGFRLVWNCLAEGGQTVDHIHLHLLGGRQMKWPPG